jgi:hypothetical protein
MFTIHIYLRFVLMGLLILGGIVLSLFLGFWYAFPFILVGVLLAVGYILLGTVQSAAKFMQNMDFLKSEERLGLTFKPGWLYKANRAYYYLIKGTIAAQLRNDSQEAEAFFLRSQQTGLPSDNEEAMVFLQLANMAATKNKWNQAKNYFRNAKKLKVTEPQLKDQIKQFEKALSNRGQMKHLQGQKQGGRIRRMKRF